MARKPFDESDLVRLFARVPAAPTPNASADAAHLPTGTIAQLAWDSTVILMVVEESSSETVTGYSAGLTPPAPGLAGRVDPERTTLGVPLHVDSVLTSLPAITINQAVGQIAPLSHESVGSWVRRTARHDDEQFLLKRTVHPPTAFPDVTRMAETFSSLTEGGGDMWAFLRSRSISGAALARILKTSVAESLTYARGHRTLSFEQETSLANALNVSGYDIRALREPLPEGLVVSLGSVRYRRAIVSRARRDAANDSISFEAIARQVLGSAARSDGASPDVWRHRIDRYLEGVEK